MKQSHSKFSVVYLPVAASLGLTLLLSGCSNLHDVDNRWCDPEPVVMETKPIGVVVPPPPPVAPAQQSSNHKFRLEADALFKFNGSKLADIKPGGKKSLDELVSMLNKDFTRLDKVVVTGHTDRLGSAAYNQRLSQQRAETVKQYLSEQGIKTPIETKGAGKADPITTDCKGNKASPALIQCLQQNRRVEVEIVGVSKEVMPLSR